LAERIVNSSRKTLSGFRISAPSNVFVAKDINNVDALTAIRYLSRHDGFMAKSDAQGMTSYIHQLRGNKTSYVSNTMILGGIDESSMDAAPNRVTVRGKSRANNDDNVVQVDDIESQKDGIREVPGGIFAPTANNRNSTKNIGRKFLTTAKRAKGAKTLKETVSSVKVRAGDTLSFLNTTEKTQNMVLKVRHHLIKKRSDIQISSVQGTLEDLMQRAQEGDISSMFDEGQERTRQIKEENYSVGASMTVKTSWVVLARQIRPEGMIIGHPTRAVIGADSTIPSAQAQPVTLGNPQGKWTIKGSG